MRYWAAVIAVVGAGLCLATAAEAQGLRSVGIGPSQTFEYYLPSQAINRTLGGSYGSWERASKYSFYNRAGPAAGNLLGRQMDVFLQRSGYDPVTPGDLAPGLAPTMMARVRSIDSLNFASRGRFAKLRETMLALEEQLRQSQPAGLAQVGFSFRQFMFPFPLADKPEIGYGFFSRLDVVGGGTAPPEAFLTPFTADVQQSLGDKRFLDLVGALLTTGKPAPDGMKLEQCYDPQLAALGNYLFNNGRYPVSAEVWGVLAQRDPKNVTALRAVGLALLGGRQMKKAAAELRRSLTATAGWPDKVKVAGSNLQDVFPSPRDLADVRGEVEAQLIKQPDDADLGFLEAFLDVFQGRWSFAEERLAKLAGADEAARGLLGLLKNKAVAETVHRPADSALRRAADEMTGLEEPALTAEARARLLAALKSGPSTYEDYMRIGDFRFFMGDYTLAGEAYRAAHKAKPENPFALFAMTHAAFANGEERAAVRCLEEALALEPNWGLYEFRLQEFYGDLQEFERQLKNLERQVELRPQSADLKFLLAYVYYFSGRYSDAGDVLAQVLRLEPAYKKADYFLRLSKLQG